MADEALDWLMGGGGPPAFSFKEEGAQVLGKVLAYEMAQERDFHSKELLTWDDGRPRMQMVITMQSEEHPVTDEDDGKRRLFVKYGAMREAIQKAIKDSGAASIIGGRLWVKHSGYGESKKNPTNPPKAYKAKFGPASAAEMLDQITGPEPEVPTQTATWPEDNEYSTEPF